MTVGASTTSFSMRKGHLAKGPRPAPPNRLYAHLPRVLGEVGSRHGAPFVLVDGDVHVEVESGRARRYRCIQSSLPGATVVAHHTMGRSCQRPDEPRNPLHGCRRASGRRLDGRQSPRSDRSTSIAPGSRPGHATQGRRSRENRARCSPPRGAAPRPAR